MDRRNPKIDRQGVRTPAGLEQKYNFEKRFDEAANAVIELDKKLDQTEVFNRLTNNGKSQGVFIGDDGQVYINASYLVTGILKSRDSSTFYLDLENGILKGRFAEFSISGKSVEDITSETLEGQTQEEAFNKLTNDGNAKGIFYQDGELYINASYIIGAAPVGILQSVYPVGAIYISTVATNPATLFGFGTWEQIKDRFLLASGDTYAADATGGEATHTLTVDEMPTHGHKFYRQQWFSNDEEMSSGSIYSWKTSTGGSTSSIYLSTNAAREGQTGGSQPHNNMPPYLAVFIWKRVS